MHRSSLVLLLLVYSCSAVSAKNTWWSNVMDGGETRTTSAWTKSVPNPVVQLSLGTSVNKRKVKAAINTAAQTPKKFWESKTFETLLRENQKDGLDNVQPVRQVFKSWEYTKEGNKPAKLVEKSWEKTGEFIIPPTVTVIEHNNQKSFKLNEWTTQVPKQTPPVRWDDKPEFSSSPKHKKNFQKMEFEKQRDKPKVKIVAKKLVTLKKTLETEDIPIDGRIINNNHHESTRLIKKEGLIEEPKKPDKPQSSAKIWFKMPSTERTTERLTTPQVEYAIEDVSPGSRRRPRKQQLNLNQNQNNDNVNRNNDNLNRNNGNLNRNNDNLNRNNGNSQNQNANQNENRPQRQQEPAKFSYRFQWGKRSDENEPPKSENLKVEEPVTDSVSRSNDDDDEEVTSIKELEEFHSKWEGLARRTFRDNQETTTQLPARLQKKPKTEKIEKSNRQAVRLKENSEDFDRNLSAKEKPARQIYSFTTSIDHGSFKEEKPQKLKADINIKVNARIQKKSEATEEPPKPQNKPSRLQKRIDTREREILEDINQRKHNYEIEEVHNERSGDQRAPKGDQGDDGKEWRLEDSIPGVPGQDYATFETVPQTNFKCSDHKLPGYYGDVEAKCQAFHVCQADGRQDSFVCPVGTVFNQQLFVCDWWNNFKCDQTPNFYDLNANLYDYSKGGGGGPVVNKPRGIRGADAASEVEEAEDDADGPDVNAPIKSGSIYAEEETKGGSHRSSQVYFPESTGFGTGNAKVWKRKLQTEAVTERRSDTRSTSSHSDEDEYWAASEEMPAASFATRLSSLLKVKSREMLSEQKAKQQ